MLPTDVKGSAMVKTNSRIGKRSLSIAPLFIVLFCLLWPGFTTADDHKNRGGTYKRHESSEHRFDNRNRSDNQGNNQDEGNEITGQTTMWLLVAANLTIALSVTLKALLRYLPLDAGTKSSIKKFNRQQKKHLMRFHYILNPVALGSACLHFLLSSCRSSSLPEWGMIMVLSMVFFGFILKFKLFPRKFGKFFHRLHTTPVFIIITVSLLVIGHQFVG